MKPCPYCAELIQDQAAKCRFCGEWLDPSKRPAWSQDGAARVVAPARTPPLPSRASEMLLDDPPRDDTSSTLPVGSGLPDLDDRGEPPRTWSAPAWLANAQAARTEPRAAEVTDRNTLEEVALRMERIRQSAAAVREAVDPAPRAVRPAQAPIPDRATLEVEPGVTLPAGSLRAVGLDDRGRRRAAHDERAPVTRAPRPAPVLRDPEAELDDFGDLDELEDEPAPRRRARPRRDPDELSSERPTIPDIPRDQLHADDVSLAPHRQSDDGEPLLAGRRRRAREAMPPAPTPAALDDLEDDEELDDLLPPRAAGAGFDEGFLDDDEPDDDDYDDEDFAAAGPAPRPLPWRPILIAAAVIVAAGVMLFRDSLFPSDPEVDGLAEAADAGEAGEAPPETKADPQPPAVPDAKAAGEGQPVEADAKADGGEAAADGGAATPTPPAPAALDSETLAKLDEARKAYESANGSSRKLQPVGETLQEILAKAPDHPEALTLMAQVYLEQGKMDEALRTSSRCTEVSAESAGCWLTIGVIQETKGAGDVARLAYQKYLDLAPEGRYANDARKALGRLK